MVTKKVVERLLLEVDTGAKGFVVSGKAPHTLSDVSSEGIEPLFGIGAGDDLPASNFLQVTRRLPIEAFEAGGLFVQRDLEATWINYDDQQKMVGPRGMPGLLGHSRPGWSSGRDRLSQGLVLYGSPLFEGRRSQYS